MTFYAKTPDEYISIIPAAQQEAVAALRATVRDHIPAGFEETICYNMIAYVIPHSTYPAGYHCDPKIPLPFINIGAQKNFVALYHMGIYAQPPLLEWFTNEYPNYSTTRLDMGKSCMRFKKPENIPHPLIAQLVQRITPADWMACYENLLKR